MITVLIILIGFGLLITYPPIFKPWFGYRKPKGHSGKWGE